MPQHRFNDGKVSLTDASGRHLDDATLKRPLGALYRLDPEGNCSRGEDS